MGGDKCINCGSPETTTYDLTIRNTDHDGVALCNECHEAIQRELASSS